MLRGVAMQQLLDPTAVQLPAAKDRVADAFADWCPATM